MYIYIQYTEWFLSPVWIALDHTEIIRLHENPFNPCNRFAFSVYLSLYLASVHICLDETVARKYEDRLVDKILNAFASWITY